MIFLLVDFVYWDLLVLFVKKKFCELFTQFISWFPQDENAGDAEHMEEDVDGDLADIEALNYDDLDSVSKLQKTQRYNDIMQVNEKF